MDISAMPWAAPTQECTSGIVQVPGHQVQKGKIFLNLSCDLVCWSVQKLLVKLTGKIPHDMPEDFISQNVCF